MLVLEKKKETIISVSHENNKSELEVDSNDEDEEEFDEYLDWRCKKAFK